MIQTQEELLAVVERAKQVDAVGFDTEFVWERTFYPQLGLIQIAMSTDDCVLIDPVAIKDLSPLAEIIEDPNIVKILHDCQQDLFILCLASGATSPKNIFDTRTAAGFAGLASTISLQNLLKDMIGIELAKTESRTNWLQRPLSDKQLEYALDDVKYLHEVREKTIEKATKSIKWMEEELGELDNPNLYTNKDPYQQYKRVKGYGYLNYRGLAILREVTAWREGTAIAEDKPRKHILTDEALIGLCQEGPESEKELAATKLLFGKKLYSYGKDIIAAVAKGNDVPKNDCPQPPQPPENRNTIRKRVQDIKKFITSNSERYKVDPALIGTRAELEAMAEPKLPLTGERHRMLRGWRKEFMGKAQLQNLTGTTITM